MSATTSPLVDWLAVAVILIVVTAVLCGFSFLLWIVATRAPESPLTQIETIVLVACLCALCLYAGSDD